METVMAKFDIQNTLNTIRNGRSVHFHKKENRDKIYSLAKAEGLSVRKSSIRNQQLHPEYLEDFEGSYETGFGNTDYQRFWSNLYNLEVN